jgi:hypothetical protein
MNIVADHLKSLLEIHQLSPTQYKPIPKANLSTREYRLFWRYHGHFPNDFAKAIVEALPTNTKFISYDHLHNVITVEVL